MGRTYAGILGPLAFVTILTRTLIDGGGSAVTVKVATVCLFVFAAIGYVAGQIADSIVGDAVRARFDDELKAHRKTSQADAAP